MRFTRITIVQSRSPSSTSVNEQLQWFGDSLGLFNLRDKDKSCFRVFIALLRDLKRGEGLTSDEIAHCTGLSRGTVVHHLNKLIDAGLVEVKRARYMLTVANMESLVDKIQEDIIKTLEDLRGIGKHIDKRLQL